MRIPQMKLPWSRLECWWPRFRGNVPETSAEVPFPGRAAPEVKPNVDENEQLMAALRAAMSAVIYVDEASCIFRALARSVAMLQLGSGTYELLKLEVQGLMVPLTGRSARRAALAELIARLKDRILNPN